MQATFAADSPSIQADLILKNARIYTDHDAGKTWSQAASIRQGNIHSIGTNQAIEKERGPNTQVLDLGGRVVLPGFNDAHVHFLRGGLDLARVKLHGISSIAKMQEAVKSYVQTNPNAKWILGSGWDKALLPSQRLPNKTDLDLVTTDKPALFWNADHNAVWINSKAAEELKIQTDTGILIEKEAFLASARADSPRRDELKAAFKRAQDEALKSGITSVQGPMSFDDEPKVVEELFKNGDLRIRYSMWGSLDKPDIFAALKEKHKQLPDEWIRFDAVKGYLDGVLSSRTAALSEPYADKSPSRGETYYTQDRLNELVLNANRLGLPVALHAIGDRAASMAVTAYANSSHLLFNSRVRNRVEHLEVVPAHIYQKFHDLGVIASFQPSHMVYETEKEAYLERRIGARRAKDAFAIRNFFDARAHLAFGSEWPVMPLDPMTGLFGAVYRQHRNGKPLLGWQPSQRVTLEQAIEAYTLGSSYATHEEHVKGSIREGKYADLVVLTKDPFKLRGKDLLSVSVYMTILNGKIVYDGSKPQIGPAEAKK